MGLSQDDVDCIRVVSHDLRHRADHVLDTLAGREQPEGEDHTPAFHVELVLVVAGINERYLGYSVRNDGDPFLGHVVDLPEHVRG